MVATPFGVSPDLPTVTVLGMPIAAIDSVGLLERVTAACGAGHGGWIVTANLDILQHFHQRADAREAYLAAEIRVADGMPLLWAARAQGDHLPERVAGSTFSPALIARAAQHGWPVLLLGGSPGSAERAAANLLGRFPNLDIRARSDLHFAEPPRREEITNARRLIEEHQSRIVLVGLGSPKQELVIRELRHGLSRVWFIGVGGTFGFLAGDLPRAPAALQSLGLEWAYRLAQEPRRLARRYLWRNLPFAVRLLTTSAIRGFRSHR